MIRRYISLGYLILQTLALTGYMAFFCNWGFPVRALFANGWILSA